METLTIKLLHERKNSNARRKCDGKSGQVYAFLWNDTHKAYCYTTTSQEEADDLFNGQGRTFGSYFAPVITIAPKVEEEPISDALVMEMLTRGLDLPKERDGETVGKALVAAYDSGANVPQVVVSATSIPAETATSNSGPTVVFESPVTPPPAPTETVPAATRRKAASKTPAS